MPSRYDCPWLTSVLVAVASWLVPMVAVLAPSRMRGVLLLLVLAWTVLVAIPTTVLAVRLHRRRRPARPSYRAYRLGITHAREIDRARTPVK